MDGSCAYAVGISVKSADHASMDISRRDGIVFVDTVASLEIAHPGHAVAAKVAVVAHRQQVVRRTDS